MSFFWLVPALAAGFAARYHFWRPGQNGTPILMYHLVKDELKSTRLPKLRVKPSAFRQQMACLKKSGFSIWPVSKLLDFFEGAIESAPERLAVITFDDGYMDFYKTAAPILQEFDFTATIFLVTGQVDKAGFNFWDTPKGEPLEPLMGLAELTELSEKGFELGGHSHQHANLTSLSHEKLFEELQDCKKFLEKAFSIKNPVFSYPYGAINSKVKEALRITGFRAGLTTRPHFAKKELDPYELGRVMIKRSDDSLDFKIKLKTGKSRF